MNYDSSFSRPAGLGGTVPGGQGGKDGKVDPKVLQFIQEAQVQEQMRQQISNLTDKCWTMCDIYPRDRLDKKQETCLSNCVNRYFDTATYIADRFMQKIKYERQAKALTSPYMLQQNTAFVSKSLQQDLPLQQTIIIWTGPNSNYIAAASAPIHAFLQFLLPVLCIIFFPSHWLLSHMIIIITMVSDGLGINPIAVTIIKEVKLELSLNVT